MKVFLKGVYFLYFVDEIVYVGKSNDIYRRIYEHSSGRAKGEKKEFNSWEYIEFEDDESMSKFESFCINLFKQKYNKDVPSVSFFEDRYNDIGKAHSLFYFMNSISTHDLDIALSFPTGTFYTLIEKGCIDKKYIVENPILDNPILRRISNNFVFDNYKKLVQAKR